MISSTMVIEAHQVTPTTATFLPPLVDTKALAVVGRRSLIGARIETSSTCKSHSGG